jgi:putative DNA primase/helicase
MDPAVWERVRKVPFDVQIPKEERDKRLDEQLRAELTGILAWAVQGCLEWQRLDDLREPEAVIVATTAYHGEMDTLGRFLDECCLTTTPDLAKVKATALTSAYHTWCKHANEHPLTGRAFIETLEERGYRRERGTGNQYYWHGLGLVNTEEERYA